MAKKDHAETAAKIPRGRRRILIDSEFQYQYFRICFWTGLVVIAVAILIYVAAKLFIGMDNELHPQIFHILVGIVVFIVLFCGLIGFITVRMTHKVAGAAYGLERSIDRLRDRRLEEKVRVRKGDYLTNLAGALDELRNDLIWQKGQIETLQETILRIRESVPTGASLAVDQAFQSTQKLLEPKTSEEDKKKTPKAG